MPTSIGNINIYKVSIGDLCNISKISIGERIVYSAGSAVTYIADEDIVYQEDVDEGESCLSPTFTPTKSGWEFVGWRQDTEANGSVLSGKVMGDSPITLYAVFKQTITLTYYNGSTTSSSVSEYRYYNNGNIFNPTFSLTPVALSGWTFRGWATSSAAAADISYNSISGTAFAASATVYAAYSQTITLSYNGNGSTGGSTAAQTGTRYYNTGNYSDPSFTLRSNGFSKTNYTFSKWALGSASGTQYAAGASVTLSANTNVYALWTYVGNPFYIVKNYQVQSTFSFDFVSGDNTDGVFNVGGTWNRVYGREEDQSQNASFVARSNSINTKGNAYVRVTANFSSGGGYVKINGQTLTSSGSKVFDISGLSSIQIEVRAGNWAYSGSPYVEFNEIYFY